MARFNAALKQPGLVKQYVLLLLVVALVGIVGYTAMQDSGQNDPTNTSLGP